MKNEYKSMDCPICDEFYFSPLTEEDVEDGDVGIGDQCPVCGWIYNTEQISDKECISNLKKDFLEKRKKNPKYEYFSVNNQEKKPHLCPVCRKYIFDDVDSHDICPYCFWEDDSYGEKYPDSDGGANEISLNDSIKLYNKK